MYTGIIWPIFTLLSLIVGFLGLLLGSLALIGVIALKNSTHKVTFLDPTNQSFSEMNDQTKESLNKTDSIENL